MVLEIMRKCKDCGARASLDTIAADDDTTTIA